MNRRIALAALAIAVAATLAYLRDPAWLSEHTSGLRPWQRDADGTAYRWSGGHASFFVPADARQVRVAVATTFDPRAPGGAEPMLVTFTIDDGRGGRTLLSDGQFRDVVLEMPPRGSRHVRRVDVRTSVTRDGNHGVKIRDVLVTADGTGWRPCCLGSR
jgi:hypothetical protein